MFSSLRSHLKKLTFPVQHPYAFHNLRKMASVGIIIIGDEILKGFTKDTNSHFLCKNLHDMGLEVGKVSIVADSIDQIAAEVATFSNKFTYVITTGGIGPTHDDVTYAAISAAFNQQLVVNPEIADLVHKFVNHLKTKADDSETDISDRIKSGMKMAEIPGSSQLHFGDGVSGKSLLYPIVSVRNVYIFPGIPTLLERGFNALRSLFVQPKLNSKFHVRRLYLSIDEWSATQKLNQVVSKFQNKVLFGSYPDINNPYYKVKICMESVNRDYVDQAYDHLTSMFQTEDIVNLKESSGADCDQFVYGLAENGDLSAEFRTRVSSALKIIEKSLDDFTEDELCVSFNGGKDCTVLLHLFMAAVQHKFKNRVVKPIKILYVTHHENFQEMEKFVEETVDRYNLHVMKYNGKIKEALAELHNDDENIQAFLMGTRYSDPYSANLKPFLKTDCDWPQFMRINPMLDWSYGDIWTFLHTLQLPYCILYDQGYTSIGHLHNTKQNPALKVINCDGSISYKPASSLIDSTTERLGRT